MAKKRNYRAEYQRRIKRGLKAGYSRSVARGHAKTKTVRKDGRKKRETVELGIKAQKFLAGIGVKFPGRTPSPRELVAYDAKYTFRRKPKRVFGDDTSELYQLRLEEMARRPGFFDWTKESAFIRQMTQGLKLTVQEAYTFWFSP